MTLNRCHKNHNVDKNEGVLSVADFIYSDKLLALYLLVIFWPVISTLKGS